MMRWETVAKYIYWLDMYELWEEENQEKKLMNLILEQNCYSAARWM